MLRDGGGQNLRDYLIETAARLIDQRGDAGLGVRDIAREAKVADGVLYNYFEDKEDLLARALLVHVGAVMHALPPLAAPGAGTVAGNLASFIDSGLAVLMRVMPAFAGLRSQPKVLARFHAMVGGDAAFGAPVADPGAEPDRPETGAQPSAAPTGPPDPPAPSGGAGLPELLRDYLGAEQRLGRIAAGADVDAAVTLIVGAIHGQILPAVLFRPPGTPVTIPPGFAARLAQTILGGIAP